MWVEARDDCNRLEFDWQSTVTTTPSWKIHIMQVSCTAAWKPQVRNQPWLILWSWWGWMCVVFESKASQSLGFGWAVQFIPL